MDKNMNIYKAPSVLLVEDEELTRSIVCELLGQLDITHIHTACDGQDALRILGSLPQPPDVIVCDVYLPNMDGIEFVEHLARIGYRGGIVFVSGVDLTTMQIARDIASAHGMHVMATLIKPIHRAALAVALGCEVPNGVTV